MPENCDTSQDLLDIEDLGFQEDEGDHDSRPRKPVIIRAKKNKNANLIDRDEVKFDSFVPGKFCA